MTACQWSPGQLARAGPPHSPQARPMQEGRLEESPHAPPSRPHVPRGSLSTARHASKHAPGFSSCPSVLWTWTLWGPPLTAWIPLRMRASLPGCWRMAPSCPPLWAEGNCLVPSLLPGAVCVGSTWGCTGSACVARFHPPLGVTCSGDPVGSVGLG